jgi:hypothetical protein
VIAQQHGGGDHLANLCLSCRACNLAKGTNIATYWDGRLVPLFNPRRQKWSRHFHWRGPRIVGRTRTGKATVAVLNLNEESRLLVREALRAEGQFPPPEDVMA